MKALITVGCKTDHGGVIVLGDSSFLVEGKAVHLEGMTHYCPKCKVTSTAISSNSGFMKVNGKSIIAVGDTSTCGSKYLKISDMAVMSSGASQGKSNASQSSLILNWIDDKKEKIINKIYWSYGEEMTRLEQKSRFFDDLNLHVETSGYQVGETVNVSISPEQSEIDTFEQFNISVTVDGEGKGLVKNVFRNKTINIDTEF